MHISELGQQAGVSTRTLRHYEALGLMDARRDSNGYRTYGEADLRIVQEIRSLVDLGFTLSETRPFVDCLRSGHPTGGSCPDSIEVYERKLAEADRYLDRMQIVRDELRHQLDQALSAAPDGPQCELSSPTHSELVPRPRGDHDVSSDHSARPDRSH